MEALIQGGLQSKCHHTDTLAVEMYILSCFFLWKTHTMHREQQRRLYTHPLHRSLSLPPSPLQRHHNMLHFGPTAPQSSGQTSRPPCHACTSLLSTFQKARQRRPGCAARSLRLRCERAHTPVTG